MVSFAIIKVRQVYYFLLFFTFSRERKRYSCFRCLYLSLLTYSHFVLFSLKKFFLTFKTSLHSCCDYLAFSSSGVGILSLFCSDFESHNLMSVSSFTNWMSSSELINFLIVTHLGCFQIFSKNFVLINIFVQKSFSS